MESLYPFQPLTFSYGSLKNVNELNAMQAVKLANAKAVEKAKRGEDQLAGCLRTIKKVMLMRPDQLLAEEVETMLEERKVS